MLLHSNDANAAFGEAQAHPSGHGIVYRLDT